MSEEREVRINRQVWFPLRTNASGNENPCRCSLPRQAATRTLAGSAPAWKENPFRFPLQSDDDKSRSGHSAAIALRCSLCAAYTDKVPEMQAMRAEPASSATGTGDRSACTRQHMSDISALPLVHMSRNHADAILMRMPIRPRFGIYPVPIAIAREAVF